MASTSSDFKLIGSWKYIAYEYRDEVQPLPDPNLDVRFTFSENGISKLIWHYNGKELCERDAKYEIRNKGVIYQKITWVNPNNHVSCAQDTDMQLGNESFTHYEIKGNQLMFELDLAGESFIYIMQKVNLYRNLICKISLQFKLFYIV